MYLKVLALDLDGTLAENGLVSPKTLASLQKARTAGFVLVLVTGRQLDDLLKIAPFDQLCEAIVAENGAVLYFPRNKAVMFPFGKVAKEISERLKRQDISLEEGMAIVSTWVPHDAIVQQTLSEMHYAATIEYNKGAVMVLPPGATKGTGLQEALNELGFTTHQVIGFGDAENDRSLFEQAGLSIAVSNASPAIKAIADVVLELPNGTGVSEVIDRLIAGKIPKHKTRESNRVNLGACEGGVEAYLNPLALLNQNMGIFGASGSGKSWFASMLVEKLLRQKHQICIIDPEGDYRGFRAFPHTLLLGGPDSPPLPVPSITTLIEYANVSLILDLSLYSLEEKINYVQELYQALAGLRACRGKPHWFLLDEAHYFCSRNGGPLTDMILAGMKVGGIGLISYTPSQLAPEVMALIDHWVLMRMGKEEELALIKPYIQKNCVDADLDRVLHLTVGSAFICLSDTIQADVPRPTVVYCDDGQGVVSHVRHLHKYLRAPLPKARRFYFRIFGEDYDGPRAAASLWEFSTAIPELPVTTLQYHIDRKDFQKWLTTVLHDQELARQIGKISRRNLTGETLQGALAETVSRHFHTLERLT